MVGRDDFKSEFGRRVWDETFGPFFREEPPKEQGKPEKVDIRKDPYIARILDRKPRPVQKTRKAEEPKPEVKRDRIMDIFGEGGNGSQTAVEERVDPETEIKEEPDFFAEPAEEKPAAAASLEETIEKTAKSSGIVVSDPYEQGDNIFLELLTYFKSDVVGGKKSQFILEEDGNCILSAVSAASGLSLMLGGPSRSGKSAIIDKMSEVLTSVYGVDVASNKSFFKNYETINECDFFYLTEYQAAIKSNPAAKEALKKLTENKDAANNANPSEVLNGHLTILTTGADENKDVQNIDVEVVGRFITLRTISSDGKTNRITQYQDELDEGTRESVVFSAARYNRLKQHIQNVIDNKDVGFEDPFASEFAKKLPNTPKSIYYRTLYKSLVKSCAKFDRPNRVAAGSKIILNILDYYLVHENFYKAYCDNLRELEVRSYQALIKNTKDEGKKAELKAELEEQLQKIETARNMEIDWQGIWNYAYENMQKNHPDLLNKWVKLNSTDGKVIVYDPVKQRDVYLCDVVDTRNIASAAGSGTTESETETKLFPTEGRG
jgi:hypothetical protein